jgi:hypothetical protein
MTLQKAYAEGPMVIPGGMAVSYERGAPVEAPPHILSEAASISSLEAARSPDRAP